jgi:hypothetical protein
MAVTNERVVGWHLVKGSINSSIFEDFMLNIVTDQRDVILLDNASIHKTSRVLDVMLSRGFTPCFLPPYSPEFQPIENAFSVLKTTYRRMRENECSSVGEQEANVKLRLQQSMQSLDSEVLDQLFMSCWNKSTEYLRNRHFTSTAHQP